MIRTITAAAFAIQHSDLDYEIELNVTVLGALRGVGVPVASAILTTVEPTKYGVIDFRDWRQLLGKEKAAFSISDYKRYLAKLRRLANKLRSRFRDVG